MFAENARLSSCVLKNKWKQKLLSYATFDPYTNSTTVGLQQCGETLNTFRQLVQSEAFLRKQKTIQKVFIQKYIMKNAQYLSMQNGFFSESYCFSWNKVWVVKQNNWEVGLLHISLSCYVNLTYSTLVQQKKCQPS